MIDINLIPAVLRKDGDDSASLKINIPKDILLGVGSGLILLMVAIHLVLGAIWLMTFNRLSSTKVHWQEVLPDKTKLDALHKNSDDIKKQFKMISDMTTKKAVLWAPKFNAISDALPKGLWINKMVLDKVGMTIEGSAVSKSHSEINNVNMFLSALKQNDDFMKGFTTLEVNSIQQDKTHTVEVTDFTVMAKLKITESDTKNQGKTPARTS